MKHATSRMLFAHWDGLRADRAAPERAQVEPGQIRHILADTFILGLDPVAEPTFRLAGTRVCALFGRDLKGAPFADLWPGDKRAELDHMLDLVVGETAGLVAGLVGHSDLGSAVGLELLLLPLRHRGAPNRRAIGALSMSSIPSWLGLVPLDTIELRSLRVIGAGRQTATDFAALGQVVPPPRHRFVVLEGGRSG